MNIPCNDLYFVGRTNDPRNVQVIGYEDASPILYTFETISYGAQTQTNVSNGNGDVLAHFDWTSGTHLGLCVVGSRKFAMTLLVGPGSTSFSRQFLHRNTRFEWRRISHDSYDLYSSENTRVALYRSKRQTTPVGEAHGYMQYAFRSHDSLLLEAILALCVNRWIDKNGL